MILYMNTAERTDSQELDIRNIKKRFLAINRERLRRVQSTLRWRQRDFLELLPIFFHLNHALLPGYVSKETPCGLPMFTPSTRGLEAVKLISKSFIYKKRAPKSYDIQALFLMGSMGTIAQSDKSDFDIWVCHNPELSATELSELVAKCKAIEAWAENIGLEVHFFPMNAEQFRRGQVVELSSESSGTTQHHLLLEEFYRTSILLAGRYPIWWFVPPDEEENYPEIVHRLIHNRFIKGSEVIDFGGLDRIPADEFFGAALWQVYKGIDSPYKSVLKIMLMETYADQYPNTELLSLHYKRLVYKGVLDTETLDPYLMLLSRLEDYLNKQNETVRLQLVRRCFYFKVNIPLSKANRDKLNWQEHLMWEIVENWGWDEEELELLDNRNRWKVQRVLGERKLLVDELTHSYLFLSSFAREQQGLSRISQKDLNVLGRKLYAAFERKVGKIELVNRGISLNIVEPKITLLQQVAKQGSEESWSLMVEDEKKGAQDNFRITLKRGKSIIEILTWCHFNRIINPGTVISIDKKDGILSLKEVKSILEALEHEFSEGAIRVPDLDDFSLAPYVTSGVMLANVGMDPLPNHSRRGTDIVSDRSDILNYSGFNVSLALSCDLVIVTSWHEILTYHYNGVEGLLECLIQYLWWHKHRPFTNEFEFSAYSFSSSHGMAIAKRIEELFSDLRLAFFSKAGQRKVRYLIEIQSRFYLLQLKGETIYFEKAENFPDLCQLLSRAQDEFIPIVADRAALKNSVLPKILTKNRPGKIQFFYEVLGREVAVYVLDRDGSLFYHKMSYYDEHSLLNQFILFFTSIISRQNIEMQSQGSEDALDIEYLMVGKRGNKVYFERKMISRQHLKKRFFHVQVIANVVNQKSLFTVYCDDKEFTSYEFGVNLFSEVAKYVLKRRQGTAKYPVYITDLDLAPQFMLDKHDNDSISIIDYLQSKIRIEEKLNHEMSKL